MHTLAAKVLVQIIIESRREFGLFVILFDGLNCAVGFVGFVSCKPDEDGAPEDAQHAED